MPTSAATSNMFCVATMTVRMTMIAAVTARIPTTTERVTARIRPCPRPFAFSRICRDYNNCNRSKKRE
jgi:hypothetical protein